ncbi:hypothetical protein BDB01DRAFT_317231 [Pilobolus umbonatus]|nr:hypothetical protein BDB01DRAFT_317231 [Pilobolus umbonatus]
MANQNRRNHCTPFSFYSFLNFPSFFHQIPMWIHNNSNNSSVQPIDIVNQNGKHSLPMTENTSFERYSEDDDTITETGATMSDITLDQPHRPHQHSNHHPGNHPQDILSFSPPIERARYLFEKEMNDSENGRVSRCQNTYFMDGGNRFISLPTLGNTSTRAASHISRVFEDWLQNKLYNKRNDDIEKLPILEDSVELIAEDIVNKLKSRTSIRGLIGLAKVSIKIRTGHIYTYHQLEDGQPLITADMEDFFQQFPLFVEIIINTMPRDTDQSIDDVQLLLAVENVTINPGDPYHIREDIQLIV